MNAPAFTPGPWSYHPDGHGGVRIGSDMCGVAFVHDPSAVALGYGPMLEANARLIAAAPELYEAAKQAEYEVFACLRDESVRWNADVLSALQTAYDALRRALAKVDAS